MQLSETRCNHVFQDLNNRLTQVLNLIESEKKKNEELKEKRENTKNGGIWWENPVEGLGFTQLTEFKGNLENLMKIVTLQASKILQATVPNFYVGSSSNAAFGVDDGSHHNPDLDMFSQRRMMDINAFNHNNLITVDNHAILFGSNSHNNVAEEFIPGRNMNYRSEYNPNPNRYQNQVFKRENFSEYEHHHDHSPHSRYGYY